MDEDPEAAALRVKVPLLFIYGETDPWIPVEQSVKKLQVLRQTHHNFEYLVVHNADHEMMFPVKETMEVDAATIRNDAPQSPTYFLFLGSWLTEHAEMSR